MLTHISLFAGIGGIDIAAGWAGFETVLFCEKDDYCQKVLNKHCPDVPIIGDIRDVTREAFERIIANSESRESWKQEGRDRREGVSRGSKEIMAYARCEREAEHEQQTTGIRKSSSLSNKGNGGNFPITLITGGFPCQPFSVAGKRHGKEDDRYLWSEMFRVIKEFKPTWVVGENVSGIINMALDSVCADLEGEGYETQAIVLPACGVNAPHRRYRVFIVGYSECNGYENRCAEARGEECESEQRGVCESSRTGDVADSYINREQQPQGVIKESGERISNGGKDVTNTEGQGLERADTERDSRPEGQSCEYGQGGWQGDWWAVEPDVGRVAYGVPNRVDRLKCLGNAVVPQQIYPILKAIADIEQGS